MKKYIGIKMIKAEHQACEKDVHNSKVGDPGYKVEYEDGYVSWSPAAVFEKAYEFVEGLSFGMAIEAMKKGEKVARAGWNGKGMWISITNGQNLHASKFWNKNNREFAFENGDHADVLPVITMKTADNKILMGWLASQTDMLSNDWQIV